jgi:hypothetical protein
VIKLEQQKKNSSQAEINKLKNLMSRDKFNDLFLKQQRQLEDDKIAAIISDGYEKKKSYK